jgi:putative CocE/NonD family hydrolase
LKNNASGLDDEPAVRYFVMGLNRWRSADDWPPKSVTLKPLYFGSRPSGSAKSLFDGSLSWKPSESNDRPAHFTHDPAHPVESIGGNTLYSLAPQGPGEPAGWNEFNAQAGPRDQRPIEDRCITFTTDPLEADLEVTGPVIAKLFISSTGVDTDFVVRLTDVHPDGRSVSVCDGIQRARYRNSNWQPSLLEPGRIYELSVDLWATSHLFRRDHRLRVVVNSSCFPRFDVNPGTGESSAVTDKNVVTENTVYLDREHPSHLVLPVDRN